MDFLFGSPIFTITFYEKTNAEIHQIFSNCAKWLSPIGSDASHPHDLGNAAEKIMALTNQRGVDVAIEAIGIPASFDICQAIVTVGGHIANVGVHGKPVQLHLDKLWSQNITLTTRLVNTVTTPMLLKTVVSGKLQPNQFITHHFTLDELMQAYDTFGDAMKENALKEIITNGILLKEVMQVNERKVIPLPAAK
jgi:alcohol dehydrogenase